MADKRGNIEVSEISINEKTFLQGGTKEVKAEWQIRELPITSKIMIEHLTK